MTKLNAAVLLFSLLAMATAQTTTEPPPKPSDKALTAFLHIFEGPKNTAVLISRGKLPDTVGSPLVLVTDLSSVNATSPQFVLTGESFGSTGGGQLGNKTKTYSVPEGALTVDLEDCADLNIASSFVNKETNGLKLFGVIESGKFVVLPNIPKKKVGDLLEGKATIDDIDSTGLAELFEKVPDGSHCSVSWTNGNGKKQKLVLIIGKNLRSVRLIIGVGVAIIAGTGALTLFYLSQVGK